MLRRTSVLSGLCLGVVWGQKSALGGGNHIIRRGFCGRMDRAVVRCVPSEPKLTISLTLAGSYRHMLREQSEELGRVLSRMSNSVIKAQSKGKKAKRNKGDSTGAGSSACASMGTDKSACTSMGTDKSTCTSMGTDKSTCTSMGTETSACTSMGTDKSTCTSMGTETSTCTSMGMETSTSMGMETSTSMGTETSMGTKTSTSMGMETSTSMGTETSMGTRTSTCTSMDVDEPVVGLYLNGDLVPEDTLNRDAWQDGAILKVGDLKYKVERNPPTFTTAQLPASVLAGFPVCPKLEIEFGDLRSCRFQWYKESSPGAHTRGEEDAWAEAGTDQVFTPSNTDVGLRLKLKCMPGNESRLGHEVELVSSCAVEAGPGVCTFDNRHLYTCKVTDDSATRIVAYNILADIYSQTELSKTVLYPYCPPYALELDYRQNLIKKELSGYNADIICLQEVDKGVFGDSLAPALDAFGMDGVFKVKETQHEGLATFYRRSKFKLLSRHDIMLSEALEMDATHSALLEKLSTNPVLKAKVVQRNTTLQVTVLQSISDPSKIVCVGNTHLYWHPKGANVRLIQIAVALKHLKKVVAEERAGALIFCGDFNSMPSSGLYQLLSHGSIADQHSDWASNGPDELLRMDLNSPFELTSACGVPDYTNYIGSFKGCLDYIFIEPQAFQVDQVIPLPSHEEVTTYQALPSVSHPSDHIALVCDLKWK